MNRCQSCQTDSYVGALFCSNCGARLEAGSVQTTRRLTQSELATTDLPPGRRGPATPASSQLAPGQQSGAGNFIWELTLLLGQGEVTLSLASQSEFSLGRDDQGSQAILPDVDLNPFGANQLGVSRIHASLQQAGGRITITDLGSTNGTYVNGRRILSNRPYPLRTGDRLQLGELESFVYLSPATKISHPNKSGYNYPGGDPRT